MVRFQRTDSLSLIDPGRILRIGINPAIGTKSVPIVLIKVRRDFKGSMMRVDGVMCGDAPSLPE